MADPNVDPIVVEKLKRGDWQFGHAGRHIGDGTEECPRTYHHHHDAFCLLPSLQELMAAGIDPKKFTPRSRA